MKLFNKQRFQLLKGKRLQRYLLYAVGEIILVVVGIMMALGLNNWKQEQTDEKELDRIISVVKTDLIEDLNQVEEIINASKTDQKLTTKILYDSKFKDSISACEDCRYILARVNVPNFNSKGYELLSNFNKDVKTKSKQVDSILNFYSAYKREAFDIRHKIILDEIVGTMKHFRDNYDWFSEWFTSSMCNVACRTYFTGQDYMNRLAYYESLYFDDYLYGIELYQKDLEAILRYL
jgi:hypothetical protein